ncbi:hypothetical protein ACQQ2N_15265 [Dokdonella sp. MW10]|uniref:hypothetical protein n=1 Tax=Dokdonella sp. MW10 TaxID=2992926 RepID=UPI003F7E2511
MLLAILARTIATRRRGQVHLPDVRFESQLRIKANEPDPRLWRPAAGGQNAESTRPAEAGPVLVFVLVCLRRRERHRQAMPSRRHHRADPLIGAGMKRPAQR